jgi:NADPH:quinone reductase-like Zn-dependent oxidoreductase
VRAVTIVDGALEVREHPDPVPGPGQVLVGVRAAGINAADHMQRAGLYPAPPGWPADIPGMELAGIVEANGPGAARFAVGDRVMAVVGGGAQAELAIVHERELMPVPAGLDWPQAGGLPEAFLTAHDALFSQCGLRMGERACVHGGAGGVGTAAVQLAAAAGAGVVATVRNPDLRPPVAGLAPGVVAVDPDEMEAHGPYDVVLELIGAPNMEKNLGALATGGRIAVIGVGAGAVASLNLFALMGKRARIHGSTLRARPLEEKAAAARALEHHALPLFTTRQLSVPVAATFSLSDAAAAYDRFAAGAKFGKVVLVTEGG